MNHKLIGIKQLIREIRDWRGYGMHPYRVHELIATHGLPAYRDELRRTPRFLFRWDEVRAFLEAHQPKVVAPSERLWEGGR